MLIIGSYGQIHPFCQRGAKCTPLPSSDFFRFFAASINQLFVFSPETHSFGLFQPFFELKMKFKGSKFPRMDIHFLNVFFTQHILGLFGLKVCCNCIIKTLSIRSCPVTQGQEMINSYLWLS